MKRDLLLVNPPQLGLLNGFANGLIDLANFVADRNPAIEVSILDLAITPSERLVREAQSALAKFAAPPVIGITTTTASYRSSLQTARAFKAVAPDSLVVLGGHHASPQHDVVLQHHSDIVDVVVRGEGEYALLALSLGHLPEKVAGCSTDRLGELRVNPAPALMSGSDLDSLPVTFRGTSFLSDAGKFEHATYVSSRGCPLQCSFCAVANSGVRSKSVERVIDDICHLVEKCSYRNIAIEDNFFAQNKRRVLDLCAGLERVQRELKTPFAWDCQTRVESMRSKEVRAALARAGCEAVYLGVESLIEEELEYLGKTSRPNQYVELTFDVCKQILDEPYDCYINLQLALPHETDERQRLRLRRLAELGRLAAARGRTITVFPQLSVVYPGTVHFWQALERGTFGRHGANIFEPFCEWEAEEQPILRFLGENFAHGVGGIPLGILSSERLRRFGEFAIVHEEIQRLKRHLDELQEIDGITLFKYGAYLFGGKSVCNNIREPLEARQ